MDPKRTYINYLYFGGFYLLLAFLIGCSIFMKENLVGSQIFFFLYALGQVTLEIFLFIFLAILIRRFLGKFCFALFIGSTFVALIFHIFDLLMDRILDQTIWGTLKIFVFDESLENFLYLLDASGIPLWIWGVFFVFLASLPGLGYLIYRLSETIALKKPYAIRHALFFQTFLCIPVALFFWDFSASKIIDPDAYSAFIKSLPWKCTFLHPKQVIYPLRGPVKNPQSEKSIIAAIEEDRTVLSKRPNIYIFVVESLREDAITAEVAPHLHRFKTDFSSNDMSLSSGNGTHLSWFSIFHSQFPFLWNYFKKERTMGSPALHLLKKWGYQVRLYTSAQLGYCGMEELLFGDKQQLLDSRQTFHHAPPASAADADREALTKLQKDLLSNPNLQEGQVFIVFWDGTHFDYSWPKNWSPKFTPFAQELAYFKAFNSKKSIAKIMNRYHNAVNYMDHLFGDFLKNLPNKEEAIVVFTGDHGEEFFEHGHLFHNSHLTNEQMHIPLYFKFGPNDRPIAARPVVSQMDIFPSIVDYLAGITPSFFEGQSLFREASWPYAVISRFNAGGTPFEFCIHNGKNKVIAQFLNRKNIYHSKELQILSLRNSRDEIIHEVRHQAENWIEREFGPALERLFSDSRSRVVLRDR